MDYSPSCCFRPVLLCVSFETHKKGCLKDVKLKNDTEIKSNLFIVTHHVHKCTDGEILRYKTVLMDVCIAFIHDLQWCMLLVFYSVVSAEEKMDLHVFYAMQCKTCYSAVRVSVAGV